MDNVMIRVEDVSMRFRMANDKLQSLKEYAIALAKRQLKYKDFWVFKNVNFEVKKGEVIGIIGRNGAGKSTLLKIIAGVLTPTSGTVTLNGNVVPMLELGSGFDIDLSGRENIFLNGSILGYSEEFIKEKYDDIVAFSGLEEFIEVPIRNYSSGMLMRLAFSIATIVQPEILIVDEILAVGDEAFQRKSKRKMLELMGGGTTVLFVSHSIDQIREMCSRVVWLEDGEVRMAGETKAVCDAYQEYINPPEKKEDVLLNKSDASKYYMDVLFIYGETGENYYWRVAHQKEQLLAGNLCSSEIHVEQLTDDLAKKYRVFVVVQCEYSEKLEEFIKKAKKFNKTVLFDISYCADREESYKNSFDCLQKVKALCDGVVTSNKKLAQELEKLECSIYCNSNVANDRMEQLSQWAVYDREILPELPQKHLTDLELINYNRAVAEKKKRQEEGLRIGIFEQFLNAEKLQKVEQVIKTISGCNQKISFFVLKGVFSQDWIQKTGASIIEASCVNREDLERIYSSVDIQLAFPVQMNELDYVEQNWILSALVKVPYVVCCGREISEAGNQNIDFVEEEKIAEVFSCFAENPEHRKKVSEKAYELVKKEYTALKRGVLYASFIRSKMKTNKVYAVPSVVMQSEMAVLAGQALAEKQQGIDVLFLNEEDCDEDICIGEEIIPVLSKAITYIYGSFDKGMATAWNTFYFLQNYPNIKEKYYWVQGYEAEKYSPGEFARFSCTQTYEPCIDVTFIAATERSGEWLRQEYSKSVEQQVMVFQIENKQKTLENGAKKKLLIEGSRYYEASELDEVFRVTDLIDREKYEIWYLSAGASEKEWYSYDKKFESLDYQALLQVYEESDVLLQGVARKRYESAVKLMAGTKGISVIAEESCNAEYADESCQIYMRGNVAMAAEMINRMR